MVKNEEKSIELTIKSVKNHIKHIIVFDTGSTDNTINIMKETCKKYNMILHLKIGQFKSFPESRNEALEFAETINIKNLILMDAGDEFNCYLNPDELYYCLRLNYKKLGIVKQQWIYNDKCEEHTDIRFVKNKENMRYDILYPVHEKIKDAEENVCDFSNIICLYQNRDLY
jgi:glycosyltransferase involved in cell wall biosynthesis